MFYMRTKDQSLVTSSPTQWLSGRRARAFDPSTGSGQARVLPPEKGVFAKRSHLEKSHN
jgi:hypothetical protein